MSSVDFNKTMLPHNRKELFFDIIKNHYRTLMVLGLILLLSSIPLLVISFIADYQIAALDVTDSAYEQNYASYTFYMDLFKTPCLFILGVGVGSVLKVIKNLCYLEPVFLGYDLKSGLKNNWLSMGALFFIVGVFNAATMLLLNTVKVAIILGVAISLLFTVLYPPLMLVVSHIAIYKNKFHKRIYRSFFMYVKYFLPTLGIYILTGLPFLLVLIPDPLIKYGVFVVLCVFLVPICYVIAFLYSSYVFDKCINQFHFPELVDKGINRIK